MSGTVHLKHRRIAVTLKKEIRSGQVGRGTTAG